MESTAQYWKPVWGTLERYWKPVCEKREGAGRMWRQGAKKRVVGGVWYGTLLARKIFQVARIMLTRLTLAGASRQSAKRVGCEQAVRRRGQFGEIQRSQTA